MSLEKMRALHAHIKAQDFLMPETLDSWMEEGTIKPVNTRLSPDQYAVARLEYDAVFLFDRFTGNPALLIAIFSAWLMENDSDRDDAKLAPPDIDVDMIDDKTAQVEIRVRFLEQIAMTRSSTGKVLMGGERWDVSGVSFDVVDTIGVGDDQSRATDQPYTRDEP